jgi:hypothetical protein
MCTKHMAHKDWRAAEFARRLDTSLWNLIVQSAGREELRTLAGVAHEHMCYEQLHHVWLALLGFKPSWAPFARATPYAGFEGTL